MMIRKMMLMVFALLLLAACGGPAAPVAEAPAAVEAAPVEVAAALDLPASVDVQTVAEIKERDDVVVLDVREQWEYDEGHIPGVVHIPMNDVPARLSEIPTDQTVIVSCRSGNRSGQVTNFLRDQGFENVHNMDGGILAWQAAGLPVE
jgi:phage shock protein E